MPTSSNRDYPAINFLSWYQILNTVAKDIFLLCDGTNTIENIVIQIYDDYDCKKKDQIQKDVIDCLGALENIGLIEKKTREIR